MRKWKENPNKNREKESTVSACDKKSTNDVRGRRKSMQNYRRRIKG